MKPIIPETIDLQELLFENEINEPAIVERGFETETDNLETETFWVDGFSTPFNLAGLRRNIQQYANKFHQGIGRPETNIDNGKKFFLKYVSRAKQSDVVDLRQMLRKSYPQFLTEILKS